MAKSKKKVSGKTVTTREEQPAEQGESSRVKQVAGWKQTAQHGNSKSEDNELQQPWKRSKCARNMPNIDKVQEKETSKLEDKVITLENSEDDAVSVVMEENDDVCHVWKNDLL